MKQSNKSLLIAGSTGFLGKRLYDALKNRYDVTGISRSAEGPGCAKVDLVSKTGFDSIQADEFDFVVCAASEIVKDGERGIKANYDVNVRGLINLLEYSLEKGARHMVLCSSVMVYGRLWRENISEGTLRLPDTYYGMSKYIAEEVFKEFCEQNGITHTTLRFSSIYGPGRMRKWVIPLFIEQALRDKTITVFGKGERTQDFLFVDDAVRAVSLALENRSGLTFNIGSGVSVSMSVLAGLVNEIFIDNKGRIIYNTQINEEDTRYRLDISHAEEKLGYSPGYSLREGLTAMRENLALENKI